MCNRRSSGTSVAYAFVSSSLRAHPSDHSYLVSSVVILRRTKVALSHSTTHIYVFCSQRRRPLLVAPIISHLSPSFACGVQDVKLVIVPSRATAIRAALLELRGDWWHVAVFFAHQWLI